MYLSYIKARATTTGSPHFLTLLIPLNETQKLPEITTDSNTGLTQIGSTDILYSQTTSAYQTFENITTDAQILFTRAPTTNLSNFVAKQTTFLVFKNRTYFQSDSIMSLNLAYAQTNISGMIWIARPTNLSLWVPETPKVVRLNGEDLTSASYNPGTHRLLIPIFQNGSLFISYNPVKAQQVRAPPGNDAIIENKKEPDLHIKEIYLSNYGTHPFLFFNASVLPTLRSRVLTQSPWQEWFAQLESKAITALNANVATMDPELRFEPTLELAFTGTIRQNLTYISKAKEFLLAIDPQAPYDLHLRRGRANCFYSLALDMIYQNLTKTEGIEIQNHLGNHTQPLIDILPVVVRNNHIGIVASGIGLAGLVLQRSEWVSLGITGIDDYFTTSFTEEGGNYEGFSYAGYFLESGLKFFYALKNTGVKNYFSDSKFLNFINTTIQSLSPYTTCPLFEDSTTNPEILETLFWAAAQIYPSAPLLSNYTQWAFEKRHLNDGLTYEGSYLESSADWSTRLVERICMYSMNITPLEPPLQTLRLWPESGLAILRNGWDQNAIYFAMTSKPNPNFQFHAHYDENSFELWAYGAWLATNPGYPGFGKGEYEWVVSTEASNTLLLNNRGQQQVNTEGFQEYFRSNEVSGFVAPANSIYSSPGNLTLNPYLLGLLIVIFSSIGLAGMFAVYLRHRAYRTNVHFLPQEANLPIENVRQRNLILKVHLSLTFEYVVGGIIALTYLFLYTNVYINEYLIGRYQDVTELIPIIEIILLVAVIPLTLFYIAFKWKLQNSIFQRITAFATNLRTARISPLKKIIKLAYLPQVFFLIIFIPIFIFIFTPLLTDLINHIFTAGASTLDIQNYFIGKVNVLLTYMALSFLLYLPFRLVGIYLSGASISNRVEQPTHIGILAYATAYLLSFGLILIIFSYLLYGFFYSISFIVSAII
ncbi:MAG: heparinase II/III domain-containing protein [Candidatus Helarchaeota archaeon]